MHKFKPFSASYRNLKGFSLKIDLRSSFGLHENETHFCQKKKIHVTLELSVHTIHKVLAIPLYVLYVLLN